jgi:HK97 family phage major capsid protein
MTKSKHATLRLHSYNNAFNAFLRGEPYNEDDLSSELGLASVGFLLSSSLAELAKETLTEYNVGRQISRVAITESGDKRIKLLDRNGTAAFIEEHGQYPVSVAGIMPHIVGGHKVGQIIVVPNELLKDAGIPVETEIIRNMARDLARAEEYGFILGNGSSEPYGVLHSDKGAEIGTTTATLSFDNVRELYFSVDSKYRKDGVWIMNDRTALQLRQLKDSVGASIWRDTDDSIFSKKVYISEFMPDIESGAKPIAFGDFSHYWFLQRGPIMLQRLDEKYANAGATGYQGTEFVDGKLLRREAVKCLQIAE